MFRSRLLGCRRASGKISTSMAGASTAPAEDARRNAAAWEGLGERGTKEGDSNGCFRSALTDALRPPPVLLGLERAVHGRFIRSWHSPADVRMLESDDTICAVASAPGTGLRAVIRISGAEAVACTAAISDLTRAPGRRPSRQEVELELGPPLGKIRAACYVWPTCRSYTGQPAVELQVPGAVPIQEAVIERLSASGARPAAPGEFTMRAFLNGRLDLLQAEAVLGAIHADQPAALRRSLAQLAGGISRPLESARERLLEALAHLEAGLDFVEEDIEFIGRDEILAAIQQVREELATVRHQMGQRAREQVRTDIVFRGLPNAGKSTLMNVLAETEVAIVSPQSGTTRDTVEAGARFGDWHVRLIDTAGIEHAGPPQNPAGPAPVDAACHALAAISSDAQQLGGAAADRATLQLVCLDSAKPQLDPWEQSMLERADDDPSVVAVGTRCDLSSGGSATQEGGWQAGLRLKVSAISGAGIEQLRESIATRLHDLVGEAGTATARSAAALEDAQQSLDRALGLLETGGMEELLAAELRGGLDAIGRLTGRIYTDDILDQIFSRFCIGK